MFTSLERSGLCNKEIAVARDVTVGRIISPPAARILICCNQRGTRDAFMEAWLENHAGELPVVYFHNGNEAMAVLFRQLMPQCLMIGGGAVGEYDPMREIPAQLFFSELAARSRSLEGRISVPYLKGIATLLSLDHFEPTLYRLNAYANGNLGAIIARLGDALDDATYVTLNRCMNKTDALIENTLDYLDMLCDACGENLNRGSMRQGKSVVSALRGGGGVVVDTSELSNPVAADMLFVQLSLARKQGIDFAVALDADTLPARLGEYLIEIGASRVCLMLCPDIWSIAGDGSPFARGILSSRDRAVFIPNGNMQACRNLSGFLDTYWRENRTITEGSHRGRSRRALKILPTYTRGQIDSVAVTRTRESLLSANELRALPYNTAIMLVDGVQSIVACVPEGL